MQKANGSSKATARAIGTILTHSTTFVTIRANKHSSKTCCLYNDAIDPITFELPTKLQ